ncbi:hypothetical protein Taro_053872 [Colocasia esculenta]|uniref:Uncharacterized protein n=1 Tax=Colocasia esculenta TaxID=4460 RepID=A0A843XM99_COLES|nr:hypothetical protein [Colocasia esculenta]
MSVLELVATRRTLELRGKRGVESLLEISWLDWDAEVYFRSSCRRSPASPFLTASLIAAPEPLREARRGTVVGPDCGGYCCVTCVLPRSDET